MLFLIFTYFCTCFLTTGILIENMRREGFELSVSPPRVMWFPYLGLFIFLFFFFFYDNNLSLEIWLLCICDLRILILYLHLRHRTLLKQQLSNPTNPSIINWHICWKGLCKLLCFLQIFIIFLIWLNLGIFLLKFMYTRAANFLILAHVKSQTTTI